MYLKFHIFNNVDNPEIATRFMNLFILRLTYAVKDFFSNAIS